MGVSHSAGQLAAAVLALRLLKCLLPASPTVSQAHNAVGGPPRLPHPMASGAMALDMLLRLTAVSNTTDTSTNVCGRGPGLLPHT